MCSCIPHSTATWGTNSLYLLPFTFYLKLLHLCIRLTRAGLTSKFNQHHPSSFITVSCHAMPSDDPPHQMHPMIPMHKIASIRLCTSAGSQPYTLHGQGQVNPAAQDIISDQSDWNMSCLSFFFFSFFQATCTFVIHFQQSLLYCIVHHLPNLSFIARLAKAYFKKPHYARTTIPPL